MPACGTKRTYCAAAPMSAFEGGADIGLAAIRLGYNDAIVSISPGGH